MGLSADTTAASSNITSRSVSQLHSKPRRKYNTWSGKIFKTMLTLNILLASVMKTEGSVDWRESPFSMNVFDCTTPTMINKYHLPEDCFIPTKKIEEKQARTHDAWFLGKEYIHELSGVVCTATISRFRGYCGSTWTYLRSRRRNNAWL